MSEKIIEGEVVNKSVDWLGETGCHWIQIKLSDGTYRILEQYLSPIDIEKDIKNGDHIKITFEVLKENQNCDCNNCQIKECPDRR